MVLGNAGRKFKFPLPTVAPVYTILIFSIVVANVVLSIQSGTAHANCANQTSLRLSDHALLLKNAHLSSNLSTPGFHDEIQLPVVSRTKFPDAHMAKINKIIIFAFLFICSI